MIAVGIVFVWLSLFIFIAVGWGMNVYAIVSDFDVLYGDPVSALLIARLVGVIVAPFGGIIGWF